MAQVIRSPKQYDVCITAPVRAEAHGREDSHRGRPELRAAGSRPNVFPEKDFKMLMWPYESPHRGAAWAATPRKIRRVPRAERGLAD